MPARRFARGRNRRRSPGARGERRNGVAATFVPVDALAGGEVFDVVVANILANPLVALAPVLAGRVRAGGRIVLSGILEPQAAPVIVAYGAWFRLDVAERSEGWVALAGVRG